MKKLLIFMLFVSIGVNAQTNRNISFIYGIDPRNLIFGTEPTQNKSAVDSTIGIAYKTGNGGLQIGASFQHFPTIGYYDLEAEVGYVFKYRNRWLITPQMASKLIMRGGSMVEQELKNQELGGFKVSLNVKFKIYKGLHFGLDGGQTFRGDKFELSKAKDFWGSFVFDGTFEVVYIVEID